MSNDIIVAKAGYASEQVPEDTHTVVAVTANYWGVASIEVEGQLLPASLAVKAIQNMVDGGARRLWGYLLTCFGPGMRFEHVHPVDGSVVWVYEDEQAAREGRRPVRVGVRGPKVSF
jgi:hypothetical protein